MELYTVTCEEAPRCNLVIHMGAWAVTVTVEISGRTIQTLAVLNLQCRDALRHLTHCQQWAREIKRVKVLEAPIRTTELRNVCLWFPQIPFQTFARSGWYKGIQPAVSYVTNAHVCNRKHYPAWYITNNTARLHRELLGHVMNWDNIVQVHTPLEAWEASNLHRRVECVNFELPLVRDVQTKPPIRLWRELRINHQMADRIIAMKGSMRTSLHWTLDTIIFVDGVKITEVLDSLRSWRVFYPRIKYIEGYDDIRELSDVYLNRLDSLFPRFICICARDADGRLAARYGNRFHARR